MKLTAEEILQIIMLDKRIRMEVESDPERWENSAGTICMRKADVTYHFTDNLECPCSRCGATVVYRPFAPKKPPKICHVCAPEFIEEIKASNDRSETRH